MVAPKRFDTEPARLPSIIDSATLVFDIGRAGDAWRSLGVRVTVLPNQRAFVSVIPSAPQGVDQVTLTPEELSTFLLLLERAKQLIEQLREEGRVKP